MNLPDEFIKYLLTSSQAKQADPYIQMEYDQVNENVRALADIRFKLLALVPALGGVASYALGKMAATQTDDAGQHALVLLIALLGFLATLGITFYDQRNSELYNALMGRAMFLEHSAGLTGNPDVEKSRGGQFLERPKPGRQLFLIPGFLMKHDRALALIYAPVLGAWFYPMVYSGLGFYSGLGLLGVRANWRPGIAIGVAVLLTIAFVVELIRLDDTFSETRHGTVGFYNQNTGRITLKYSVRDKERFLHGVLPETREDESILTNALTRKLKKKFGAAELENRIMGAVIKVRHKKKVNTEEQVDGNPAVLSAEEEPPIEVHKIIRIESLELGPEVNPAPHAPAVAVQ